MSAVEFFKWKMPTGMSMDFVSAAGFGFEGKMAASSSSSKGLEFFRGELAESAATVGFMGGAEAEGGGAMEGGVKVVDDGGGPKEEVVDGVE